MRRFLNVKIKVEYENKEDKRIRRCKGFSHQILSDCKTGTNGYKSGQVPLDEWFHCMPTV